MTSLLARFPNQEVHAATTLQQIEVCCCTGTVVLIIWDPPMVSSYMHISHKSVNAALVYCVHLHINENNVNARLYAFHILPSS
jgi:hypothetical protein